MTTLVHDNLLSWHPSLLKNIQIKAILSNVNCGEIKNKSEKWGISMKIDVKAWNNIHQILQMSEIESLTKFLFYKSSEVAEHCIRVGSMSLEIGKLYGLSSKEMEDLFVASILHDVGKAFIPNTILNKPTRLTVDEWGEIKKHPQMGHDFLMGLNNFENVSKIILHHHERYDGKGYPYGLEGEKIPFLSRIISVADSFDAMISERPYKKTMSIDEAVQEIEQNKKFQFDEEIASVFLKTFVIVK